MITSIILTSFLIFTGALIICCLLSPMGMLSESDWTEYLLRVLMVGWSVSTVASFILIAMKIFGI